MSANAAEQLTPTASLRDLSMKCSVSHLWGTYFEVKTETGHKYRVECVFLGDDFEARCNCPVAVYRKQTCRHALAAIRFERWRVTSRQFN